MDLTIIERHTVPTRLDYAPYGTIVRVKEEKDSYYIQLADEEEQANWMSLGQVLDIVFQRYYDNPEFVAELLKLYFDDERHVEILCSLIRHHP